MIIAIILIVFLLAMIGWAIYEMKEDGELGYSLLGLFVGGCLFLFALVTPLTYKVLDEYHNYPKMQYERQVILDEYNASNSNTQILVYEKAKEFNSKIFREKRGRKNKWVNIYYSKKIASIDYIELYGMSVPKE